MNDILPILLPILAALVVLGALIPVLMKTRKNITNYPGKRDENDPVAPGAGGGTLLEDRPAPTRERHGPGRPSTSRARKQSKSRTTSPAWKPFRWKRRCRWPAA